jgi:dTDP-4-amino-4,6-dideoxygalactose transaminase
MTVVFVDLRAQRKHIEWEIAAAAPGVVESCRYVLGPDVWEIEKQLAAWYGASHVVSRANGTDALAPAPITREC